MERREPHGRDVQGDRPPDIQVRLHGKKSGEVHVFEQHLGIEDPLRLRRLQVRRGDGWARRQRRHDAPRLAAVRRRAGRDSGDDRCRWHVLLPPRCQQECYAINWSYERTLYIFAIWNLFILKILSCGLFFRGS